MSSLLKKTTEATGAVINGVGNIMSNDATLYLMLVTAFATIVASICIPYYTDSTGASSGVYGSGKDCLGFSSQDCMTMQAIPVLTAILVGLTVLFMSIHTSIPFLSRLPSIIKTPIAQIEKIFQAFGMTVPVLLTLSAIFAITMLGTQLGMPLSGSSLTDQAKNSSSPTTFKDGMALSATGTALIIFVAIVQFGLISKIVAKITRK